MDKIQELLKIAQALKTVKVDGEYWALMHVAVQNILNVAQAIKQQEGKSNESIDNHS